MSDARGHDAEAAPARPAAGGPGSEGARAAPTDELVSRAEARRRAGTEAAKGRDVQIIRFTTGAGHFALPLEAVERTEPVPTMTPVPLAPAWIRGAASLRGGIVCVIDLQQLLSGEASGADGRSLIIVATGGRRLGVLSPTLPDFERVAAGDWVRAPQGERDVYVGAVERDGGLVGVIDPARLFELIDGQLGHA